MSNRLVSVDDGQAEVTFSYDGLGDRVQQSEGANMTTYIHPANRGRAWNGSRRRGRAVLRLMVR